MRCSICRRLITPADVPYLVQQHCLPDGTVEHFGAELPAGDLSRVRGRLVAVLHRKCYWAHYRKQRRSAEQDLANSGPEPRRPTDFPQQPAVEAERSDDSDDGMRGVDG